MQNNKKVKWLIWSSAALFTAAAAFAVSGRFTGFFGAPKEQKLLIIASLLLLIGLLTTLGIKWVLPRALKGTSRRRIVQFTVFGMLLSAGLLLVFSTPPFFPENHDLEITIQVDKESPSHISELQVISISRVYYPGGRLIPIDFSELTIEGEALHQSDNTILLNTGELGTIHYQAFMQAGIDLVFKTGPGQGVVQVKWDGQDHIMNLQALDPPSVTLKLKPQLDLDRADRTRKVMVFSAMLAEFFTLAILITILSLAASIFIRENFTVSSPRLILGSSAVLALLLLLTLMLSQPVHFQDANLEDAIRDALDNSDKPIFRRQLLTVVSLDASNRVIFDLTGIEQLRNLSELNLRENQLSDISPLSKLKHLKKLNLRQNFISDLSPLSNNTSLEYLNLYANKRITSISPLENLVNLKTLILRDVRVGEEVTVLANLHWLVHLNLRSCEISDLSPLAGLTRLEYLNLYGNHEIKSIVPLSYHSQLRTLILGEVPINDQVKLLNQFKNLDHLNLRNSGVTDLSALSDLSDLTYLNLHSNPGITSIAPLASLVNLQTLILENVPIGSQTGYLVNFPHLVQLNISNAGVKDVSVIGELISQGAFKEDYIKDLEPTINIFNNPIDISTKDGYAALRPFWDAVDIRAPYVLPDYITLSAPVFSQAAGFYTHEFNLEISGVKPLTTVHYTLDGSEPTRESPVYTGPIRVHSRKNEPNGLSAISDTSPYWQPPRGEVFKGTTVRARVFHDQQEMASPTVSSTYFVDDEIEERYTLPVISLSTDPKFLFDPKDGIYVKGNLYVEDAPGAVRNLGKINANYHQQGIEWERPVHIEIFDEQGQPVISQDGAVRIHGHATRTFPEKSLRIYARSTFNTEGRFNYELFPGLINRVDGAPITLFENILLHNSGNDWDQTMFRDALMQSLLEDTDLDTMPYRPVIVFIDGEYWGIHNLRLRLDEYYLEEAYQVDPDDIVILDEDQVVYRGNPGDGKPYADMLTFIGQNNLQNDRNYDYIQTEMDIENYIDYQVSEIYSGNLDWPHNNVRFWRYKTDHYDPDAPPGKDGRWRWMVVDIDQGFGHLSMFDIYKHKTLKEALQPQKNGFLLSSLLQNENFRNQFINRFADYLNTRFTEQHIVERIDQMQSVLQPEIEEHIRRWNTMGNSVGSWEKNVDILREFAEKRPEVIRDQILEEFTLPGIAKLTTQTDPEKGIIQVNSTIIDAGTPGVTDPAHWSGIYFKDVPIDIIALPKPGYQFSHWEGMDDKDTQVTVTLEADLEIKAVFTPAP